MPGYLAEARELCEKYRTLLVFGEVQTGFYGTATFLASQHYDATADIVILAKAMSGGLVPSAAVLMTNPTRAEGWGQYMRARLGEVLQGCELVSGVRGHDLFNGIVFQPPQSPGLRLAFESFHKIHPAMFGQVLVMHLFRGHGMLAQIWF